MAADPSVRRVVVDIRHNYGGETFASAPVLALLKRPDLDRQGQLFVITGRNTFSAASLFAASLESETSAIFVGEPMGGSPNLYGDTTDVPLPYSRLVLTIATQYFVGSTPDDLRLTIEPDIPAPLTAADFFAGRDPALAAILAADP